MQGVMGTMQQMQQAQSAQMSALSSSINSLSLTIQQVAQATQMGLSTALQGGATAIQSIQLGGAAAFQDVQAIGSAIGSMMAPSAAAPAVGGPTMSMGGGMRAGGSDFVHGAAMGAMSLGGAVASFAAWDIAAGMMPRFGTAMRAGAGIGRAALGGAGIAGAAGAGLGGVAAAAGVLAIPLMASLAIDKAVSIGAEHVTAVRDVGAILDQNAARVMPFNPNFDPNMGMPGGRALSAGIVRDLASNLQVGRQGAAQFMAQGMELGLFTGAGAQGAGGIRERAKELADAVKDMTKMLGTSMQESLTLMAEVRQMGFEGADAPGVMMVSRGRARLGGFTAAEMHTAGVRGAQAFRGTGISPTFGFNAAQSDLATVSNLVQTGAITNQAVSAMGGRQAMADTMTSNLANYTRNPIFLAQVAAGGGGGNLQQVASMAGQNLANMNSAEVAAFLGGGLQQQIGDMGPEQVRARQLEALVRTTTQRFGAQFQQMDPTGQRNALAFMATQMGMAQGPDEARALATMSLNPQSFAEQAQALRAERHREAMEQELSTRGVGGAVRRFNQWAADIGSDVGGAIYTPFGAVGTLAENASNSFNSWWDGTRRETVFKTTLGGISNLEALRSEQIRRGSIKLGPGEVIDKAEQQKSIAQAAAVHVAISTKRKLTDTEQKAIDGALDASYFEAGRGSKVDPQNQQLVSQIFDPNVSIDVRAEKLRQFATAGVTRIKAAGGDAYDNIPGNTLQEKTAFTMKGLGAPVGVLAAAGKTSQTEVDIITDADKQDAAMLEDRSAEVAKLVFGRWMESTTSTAERDFVKAHALDFEKLATGALGAREQNVLIGELERAGVDRADAEQRILNIRGTGANLTGRLAQSVVSSGMIASRERFTKAVTEGIAGARTNLARISGGTLSLGQADILQQIESVSGGPADLVRFISELHDTGDAKTQDTLAQIAKGRGLLGPLTRDVLAGRAKADDPATIARLYEATGVSGTRDEFTDPESRKKVANAERTAIMFKKQNQTISNLMNASAALFDAVRELKRKPKVVPIGGS